VAGQVRDDEDYDGDLDDLEPGINGVAVMLQDATCTPWVNCPLTYTNGNGEYQFNSISPGEYNIVEYDPVGYLSTGDSSGANDNQIAVTLISDVDSLDNDFLDTSQISTISGQVRDDLDKDGNLSDNDLGLAGVQLELSDGICVLGSDCRTTTTDIDGYYQFSQLLPGNYTIHQFDLSDYNSTDDSVDPNDNKIPLVLLASIHDTGNDFLDSVDPDYCTSPDPDSGYILTSSPANGESGIPLSLQTISITLSGQKYLYPTNLVLIS